MTCGIYEIVNITNGKKYIGSSKNVKHRRSQHFSALRKGNHKNPHLQNSYYKYGEKSFIFNQIASCPEEYLLKLEQVHLDSLKPEYNICKEAGRTSGNKWSEDTRSKMTKILRERKNDIEFVEKCRNRMTGTKQSKSTILKRAKSMQKKVQQYSIEGELIKEFDSVTEVANYLGYARNSISNSIKRGSVTKGYLWKFKTESNDI